MFETDEPTNGERLPRSEAYTLSLANMIEINANDVSCLHLRKPTRTIEQRGGSVN